LTSFAHAQDDDIQLRILTFEEGTSIPTLTDLLTQFEAENPGIQVELDLITYAELSTVLTDQIEQGIAPDLARLTELGRFSDDYLDLRPYLSNAEAWDENFAAPFLSAMRPDPAGDSLHGFPTDFTVSGPYINRTLFEEAGVPVPTDVADDVTWEMWIDAAAQVQEALNTPDHPVYALTLDRSGHRFWGPSLSQCATYLKPDGSITIDTPGFRAAVGMLDDWHFREITPLDVWAGVGDEYRSPADLFIDGQLAFYFSGSWNVATIGDGVGDSFEWEVAPSPLGECGRSAMVGGGALTAFKYTKHPEAVGQLMSFLTEEDNLRIWYGGSFFLPGSVSLIEQGIDYANYSAALNTFAAEIPRVLPEAFALQYHPQSGELHTIIRVNLIDVMSGVVTLDEAIPMMQQEIDELLEANE
jgi:alpha-1,4-digalacturonate transport system substrate-binding protein